MIVKIITSILMSFLFISVSAADRKMLIQVNSKDPLTQKIALNNAKNLKSMLGDEAIDVEIVVYGPGLNFIKKENSNAIKVKKLMLNSGVKVSVCGGTLKAYKKRNGEAANIIEGVSKVPTGALRILELQEQGYAYMRP